MKTTNLIICITFAAIAFVALIMAILTLTFQFGMIAFIMGAVAYLALKDYKDPDYKL